MAVDCSVHNAEEVFVAAIKGDPFSRVHEGA